MISLRGFCIATIVVAVRGLNGPQEDKVELNVDNQAREGKFLILTSLTRSQTWVVVKLHNQTGFCNETRVTEGRDSNSYYYWNTRLGNFEYYDYSKWTRDESEHCIAPKACEIIVDLKDACEGTTESIVASTNSSDESLAPNSNTNDETLAPKNNTNDEALAPNNNTNDETLAPNSNTNDESLAPKNNTNDEAFAPNSNTNDESLAPNSNTNDESPIPSNKTSDESPAPSNKTKDESSVTAGLLIGLAVVVGVAATVGCIVIIYRKKSCCVKSIPEEPSQIYLAHDPFYVNLLFRKECQAEIDAAENLYEEIN